MLPACTVPGYASIFAKKYCSIPVGVVQYCFQFCIGSTVYEPSSFFRISATLLSSISVHALLLLSSGHSLGLGLDLGNSIDRREGESAVWNCAHLQVAELSIKKRQLVLNDTLFEFTNKDRLPYQNDTICCTVVCQP